MALSVARLVPVVIDRGGQLLRLLLMYLGRPLSALRAADLRQAAVLGPTQLIDGTADSTRRPLVVTTTQ